MKFIITLLLVMPMLVPVAFATELNRMLTSLTTPPRTPQGFEQTAEAMSRISFQYGNISIASDKMNITGADRIFNGVIEGSEKMRQWYEALPENKKTANLKYRYEEYQRQALRFVERQVRAPGFHHYIRSRLPTDKDLPSALLSMAQHAPYDEGQAERLISLSSYVRDNFSKHTASVDIFRLGLKETAQVNKEMRLREWIGRTEPAQGVLVTQLVSAMANSPDVIERMSFQKLLEDNSINEMLSPHLIEIAASVKDSATISRLQKKFMDTNNQVGMFALLVNPATKDYDRRAAIKTNLDEAQLLRLLALTNSPLSVDMYGELERRLKMMDRPSEAGQALLEQMKASIRENKQLPPQTIAELWKYLEQSQSAVLLAKTQDYLAWLVGEIEKDPRPELVHQLVVMSRQLGEKKDQRFQAFLSRLSQNQKIPASVRTAAVGASVELGEASSLIALIDPLKEGELLANLSHFQKVPLTEQNRLWSAQARVSELSAEAQRRLHQEYFKLASRPLPQNENELPQSSGRSSLLEQRSEVLKNALIGISKTDSQEALADAISKLDPQQLGRIATKLANEWKELIKKNRGHSPEAQEVEKLMGLIADKVRGQSFHDWKIFAQYFIRPNDAEEKGVEHVSRSPWKWARELYDNRNKQLVSEERVFCDPNEVLLKLAAGNGRGPGCGEVSETLSQDNQTMLQALAVGLNRPEQEMLLNFIDDLKKVVAKNDRAALEAHLQGLPVHIRDALLDSLKTTTSRLSQETQQTLVRLANELMSKTLKAQMEVGQLVIEHHKTVGLSDKTLPASFLELVRRHAEAGIPGELLLNTWIANKSKILELTISNCMQMNPDASLRALMTSGLEGMVNKEALAATFLDRKYIDRWLSQRHGKDQDNWDEFKREFGGLLGEDDLKRLFYKHKLRYMLKDYQANRFALGMHQYLAMKLVGLGQDIPAEVQAKLNENRAFNRKMDERFDRIHEMFPDLIDMRKLSESGRLISGLGADEMKRYLDAEIAKNNKPEAWYWSVLKAVPRTAEAVIDLTVGNAISYGTALATWDFEYGMQTGGKFINGVRSVMNENFGGSIFGTDKEFSEKSNWGLFFAVNPLSQIGKGIGGVLQGVDDGYVAYTGWVTGMNEEQVRQGFKDDWLLGSGYASLQVAKAAAGTALVLSTGGAAASGWGAQAMAAGRVWSVAGGMGLVSSVGHELTVVGRDGQTFTSENAWNIVKNTGKGAADSMLFMGALSMGTSFIGKPSAAIDYHARVQAASTRALTAQTIDIVEGLGDGEHIAQLWSEASNNTMRFGAALTTAASVFDLGGDAVVAGVISRVRQSQMPSNAELLSLASKFKNGPVSDIREAKQILLMATNSSLEGEERHQRAALSLSLNRITPDQSRQLDLARSTGSDSLYMMSYSSLQKKLKALTAINPKTGQPYFSRTEANVLMRDGFVGRFEKDSNPYQLFVREYQAYKLEELVNNPKIILDNAAFIKKYVESNQTQGITFYDLENSVLKEMNDSVIQDKDLAQAINYKMKELLYTKMQELLASGKYPGVEIDQVYNDYKSIRFAFKGNGEMVSRLIKESTMAIQAEFFETMERTGVLARVHEKLPSYRMYTPGMWFLGGIGQSPWEANFAARVARKAVDSPQFQSTDIVMNYQQDQIRGKSISQFVANTINESQSIQHRLSLNTALQQNKIVERVNGAAILSSDAVTIFRKSTSREEIEKKFKHLYGHQLSEAEFNDLYRMYKIADDFAPPVFVSVQVPNAFDLAVGVGLVSVDFSGVGAATMSQAMVGLAQIDANKNATSVAQQAMDAIRASRNGVQGFMDTSQSGFSTAVRSQLEHSQVRQIDFSGDDGLVFLNRPLTSMKDKSSLVQQLARSNPGFSSKNRVTFVAPRFKNGDPISADQFSSFVVDAEGVEKSIRKIITAHDQISPQRSRDIMIAVDYVPTKTTSGRSGEFNLIVSGNYNEQDLKIIRENFKKAIQDHFDNESHRDFDFNSAVTGQVIGIGPR